MSQQQPVGTAGNVGPAEPGGRGTRRLRRIREGIPELVRAIRENEEADVERIVLELSRRRWMAPLAFAVGALSMLYEGLRLIFANWRLTLVEVLPATWIWLALLDLKAHVLYGRGFSVAEDEALPALLLAAIVLTIATFFLNAVFAFAIAQRGPPQISPAFGEAWSHFGVLAAWGGGIGLALGFSALVVPRWSLAGFAISMGAVCAVMMLTYVAVPSRIAGVRATRSKRDTLLASVVGGALGALVCTPPYLLARAGLSLIGSRTIAILVVGAILLAIGFALQAGANGAVKAIKMSAKLVTTGRADPPVAGAGDGTPAEPIEATDGRGSP